MKDLLRMSLHTLRSYKLRSFLTLLGVIIGIGSVIIVTSAGVSVSAYIENQWAIFDPTGMIIGTGVSGNPPQLSITNRVFTTNDVDKISSLPAIKSVAPIGIWPVKSLNRRNGFLNWESTGSQTAYCSSPEILNVLNLKVEQGTMFEEGKNQIVISHESTKIFGEDKPELKVGDEIYIKKLDGGSIRATIVGILEQPKNYSIINQFLHPTIICPVSPFYESFTGSQIGPILHRVTVFSALYATSNSRDDVNQAQTEIIQYLNSSASDASQYKDPNSDFVVLTQQYIISRIDQLLNIVTLFITAIAMISLIVGGIGIANIMFATVTERTREIGIMMAVGAKRGDIMRLFLYQSTIIGMIGAILGAILGLVGTIFVIQIIQSNLSKFGGNFALTNIPTMFAFNWVIMATFVGILTGIFAGVLPAIKAARMDPVVALRHE
jgi:putative ABC transport system permease protein